MIRCLCGCGVDVLNRPSLSETRNNRYVQCKRGEENHPHGRVVRQDTVFPCASAVILDIRDELKR